MAGAKTARRLVTDVLALGALVAGVILASASPAAAVELSTPYPAIAVEPGQDVTLSLQVRSPSPEEVRLDVTKVPKGWQAYLLGGGHRVSAVSTGGENPAVDLQIQVPDDAAKGRQQVVVTAAAPSGNDTLTVGLNVVAQTPGAQELTVEFPQLRGGTGDTFRFDATLTNNTAQPAQFTMEAAGPPGWSVQARASAEEQAATVTVEPNADATIQVEADPPDDVQAGTYPVTLTASGEGTQLQQELQVQITGTPELTLQTADERLDVSGSAGDSTSVQLVVQNTGSGPLQGVELSASPPSGWETAFEPSTIESIPPGESAQVTARIRPAGEAIAGDYSVTIDADAQDINDSVDLRFAVETSSWWGLVGVLVIAAAVTGLVWTFGRFGRR